MTSLPSLILEKGTRRFDLNDRVRCFLRPDFVPPETAVDATIATGSRGEARLYERIPKPRTLTFSVRIVGSSAADVAGSVRLLKAFMLDAGDENEPLYAAFKASNDTPEPVWGQFGAAMRYEILSAKVELGNDYMRAARRARAVIAGLTLTIKPYATGKQQRAGSTKGGIIEDRFGAADGRSRGLIVPEATTNLCTNPVFSNATYDKNWTTGANLIKTQITDPALALFGYSAVELTAIGSTNNLFTTSITYAATTYTWAFYVKRRDGAPVTNSAVRLDVGGGPFNANYVAVGGGIYCVTYTAPMPAGATNTGLEIRNGRSIILIGVQVEAKGYRTPLAHGDMLGHAWTGAERDSTSTRTAAYYRLPASNEIIHIGQGSVRVVWRNLIPSTASPATQVFFDTRSGGSNGIGAWITSGQILLTDVIHNATSSVITWSIGDVQILHFTWGSDGLVIYRNGVQIATAAYTPLAFSTYLYFGSDNGAANQLNDPMSAAIFEGQLTAAQVAADYAELAPLVLSDRLVETMPWHWTKDGDDVYDNCLDSTRQNWGVMAGVPGTTPAETLLDFTASGFDSTIDLALNPVYDWVDPGKYLYADFSGTADANSSGGAYQQATIDTSGLVPFTLLTIQDDNVRFLAVAGRRIVPYLRIYDVGASAVNYRVKPYSATSAYVDTFKTLAAAWQIARLTDFDMYEAESVLMEAGTRENVAISMRPKRVTGSAGVRLDYALLMIGALASLSTFAMSAPSVKLAGRHAIEYLPASNNRYMLPAVNVSGDSLEMQPNRLNTLVINLGATITRTLTMNAVKVTPRYELL